MLSMLQKGKNKTSFSSTGGCNGSTCSSCTQEQCQYDMLHHLTKNSLSLRPARGGGSGASAGRSAGRGTGIGAGASPQRHVKTFCTFPFIGGHCEKVWMAEEIVIKRKNN